MNRRLKRFCLGVGISAVVITPPAVLLSRWMNSNSTGDVHTGSPAASTQAVAATSAAPPASLTTPYFSTTLPQGYVVKRQTKATSNASSILLQVVATSPATQDQQLAITVGNLPSGGLSDLGDYNLRATQTGSYRAFAPTGMPAGAKAFQTASGAPGFTVFSMQGSHYTEVTLSTAGGATLAQLQSAYAQVMGDWQE